MTDTFNLHDIEFYTKVPLRTLRHIVDGNMIAGLSWKVGSRKARIFDHFNAFTLSLVGSLLQSGMTLEAAVALVNRHQGCKKSQRKDSLYRHFINRDDFLSDEHFKEEDQPVKIHVDIGYLRRALSKVPNEA